MPKPVLYVPGYPGSHIHDRHTGKRIFVNFAGAFNKKKLIRRLQAPSKITQVHGEDVVASDDGIAGEPIREAASILFFDIDKQADTLYRILRRIKIDPAKFGWDWRRPVWDPPMLDRLKAAVTKLHDESGQKVVILVHSTGGLVLRALLERERDDDGFLRRIERVMAFGVPWAGTIRSLVFLAGQEGFAGPLINKKEAQKILSHSWAAFDLLPPDPEKTVMKDEDGNALKLVVDGASREISPLIRRGWCPDELREAMNVRAELADLKLGTRAPTIQLARSIPITNVVGWGWPTVVNAKISGSPQKVAKIREVSGDENLEGGDGTVPRCSAAWLRGSDVKTYHVPVGVAPRAKVHPHKALWRNPGGINLLRHHLADEALKPFLYGAVDEGDFKSGPSVRLRLVALDGDGRPLADASVRTVDLKSGPAIEGEFDADCKGRCLIRIPRSRIKRVGTQLRRLTVEIRGKDGGSGVKRRRSFFLRR